MSVPYPKPSNRCWYCGKQLLSEPDKSNGRKSRKRKNAMATRDHVKPKCEGGFKTVWACRECNSLKGKLSIEDFRAVMANRKRVAPLELVFHGEESCGAA